MCNPWSTIVVKGERGAMIATNIVGFIKAMKIRWLGHLKEKVSKECLKDTKFKIDSGRRRCDQVSERWIGDLESELRSWKTKAGNRNERKAVVTEAKVHFPGL